MLLLVTWAVVFALAAIPAAAAHAWLTRRGVRDERVLLAAPVVVTGMMGYVAFWAFFLHPLVGQAYAFLSLGGLVAYVVRTRRHVSEAPGGHDLFLPGLLVFGIGLFYLALLYLPELGRGPEWQSLVRFLFEFPPDSCLPKMLGDRLHAGESLKPFLPDAGWLSSDRPPLQTGLYLLVLPWTALARIPDGLGYQCIGTLAQLCWVPAAWLAGRAVGLGRFRATLVVLLIAASGFALFNSTFVWPKLLAAGFVLIAGVLLLDRGSPRSAAVAGLAGAAAALGWLAHGAAAFSLAPLALLLVLPRYFPGFRNGLLAAAIFGGLALPWLAYQKFYDPPANRLMKWHLAGVVPIDARTTWEALRDSYGGLSRAQLIDYKRANLGVVRKGTLGQVLDPFTTRAYDRKVEEYFYVVRSLGILNLAWVLAPLTWLWRRRLPSRFALQAALAGWTLLTLYGWALALFGPSVTIVQSSSYAMMLSLFLLAIVWLVELPFWVGAPVIAWHLLGFGLTWLPYFGSAELHGGMFFLLLAAAGLLGFALWRAHDPATPLRAAIAGGVESLRNYLAVPAGKYPLRAALLTAAAVLLVLFVRRPEVFLHPQFWAEDGSVFYLQAEFMGRGALVQSYGGYHLLLPRLLAAAAAGLDPLWIPATYFWSSILVVLAVTFALFSPRLDLPHRPWLALTIVLLPHTGEALQSLTNAQWVAALGLVLLLLARDPERRWQWAVDGLTAVLVGLTGVFSILFAPLFLLRAWLRRTLAAWLLAGLVALSAGLQAVTLLRSATAPVAGREGGLLEIPRLLGERIWASALVPNAYGGTSAVVFAVIGVLATAILAWAGLRQTAGRTTRLMWWGCLAAIFAGIVFKFRGEYWVLANSGNGDRYFFLPKILLLWLLILEWDGASPWRWAARAASVLALIASLAAFRFIPYTNFDWPAWAAKIRAGEEATIPINPGVSYFTHPGRPKPVPKAHPDSH